MMAISCEHRRCSNVYCRVVHKNERARSSAPLVSYSEPKSSRGRGHSIARNPVTRDSSIFFSCSADWRVPLALHLDIVRKKNKVGRRKERVPGAVLSYSSSHASSLLDCHDRANSSRLNRRTNASTCSSIGVGSMPIRAIVVPE